MIAAPEVIPEVIEGTWEEISREAEKFNGHRLRVTILPNREPDLVSQEEIDRRLAALREWLEMPRPAGMPIIDDSREGISLGEEDRWR